MVYAASLWRERAGRGGVERLEIDVAYLPTTGHGSRHNSQQLVAHASFPGHADVQMD
jgi:hypothetical protein